MNIGVGKVDNLSFVQKCDSLVQDVQKMYVHASYGGITIALDPFAKIVSATIIEIRYM